MRSLREILCADVKRWFTGRYESSLLRCLLAACRLGGFYLYDSCWGDVTIYGPFRHYPRGPALLLNSHPTGRAGTVHYHARRLDDVSPPRWYDRHDWMAHMPEAR